MNFPTHYDAVINRMELIDPVKYGATRNFANGAVTYLSPYISRGVISTKQVFQSVMNRGFSAANIEKFIQELAWRDYWQQVWKHKGNAINQDLKRPQPNVEHHALPQNIIEGKTGIEAVDQAIDDFYATGYMHNHMRMYVAAIACNMGKSHWRRPAQWMYYHLLDGDWASNALSWQWVAGANSKKQYFANQDNINKYFNSSQKGTFLDVPYEAFNAFATPKALKELTEPELKTTLPEKSPVTLNRELPTCIYNYYNLDPLWKSDEKMNRVLLLEPEHFAQYPVSRKALQFALDLGQNIPGLQVYVGSFNELKTHHDLKEIYFKEHPLNGHYKGIEEPRHWMFSVEGYYPSFFAFWKKCKKEMPKPRA